MPVSTRIYAGGALGFGGWPAIEDLKAAAYSTIIFWSVHVDANGDLYLNDTKIMSGGVYQEARTMRLPHTVAALRSYGAEILFSVGSGGATDFTNIGKLLNGQVVGPGNPLYDNFNALRGAMLASGGDIDGIDYDNEDNMDPSVMVNFGRTLHNVGYRHVTFCPYGDIDSWESTLRQLNQAPGVGFVNAIHLQCYSGGSSNASPAVLQQWQKMIASAGSVNDTLLIPGLATLQAQPGPWWDNGMGGSVVPMQGFAMDAEADWSNHLRTLNYPDIAAALQGVQSWGGTTFFFYCQAPLDLGPGKQFVAGDTVLFAGTPRWRPTPQCIGFSLSKGCSDIYNPPSMGGACPANLQKQYQIWRNVSPPPQGGFIWLYDSVVDCLLCGACGGSQQAPATTAQAYRNAIMSGLGSVGSERGRRRGHS
jgi:hypothetical protein